MKFLLKESYNYILTIINCQERFSLVTVYDYKIHDRFKCRGALIPRQILYNYQLYIVYKAWYLVHGPGGNSAYERGGDARRKFWIKPLKETDLGVAQPFFDL